MVVDGSGAVGVRLALVQNGELPAVAPLNVGVHHLPARCLTIGRPVEDLLPAADDEGLLGG